MDTVRKSSSSGFDRDSISIGRSSNNDVVINDPQVSSNHLIIKKESDNSYVLTDDNSTNGTLVNNRKMNTAYLKRGDTVKIGQAEIPWETYFQSSTRKVSNDYKSDNNNFSSNSNHLPNYKGVFTLGLLSLIFSLLMPLISIILGIISLAISAKPTSVYQAHPNKYSEHSHKKLKSGKTMAIIGVALSVVTTIIYINIL